MYKFPRETPKVVGTAAHFAIHLTERMRAEGIVPRAANSNAAAEAAAQ
jgi:hypothetical protein